jgi:hypothetical protein
LNVHLYPHDIEAQNVFLSAVRNIMISRPEGADDPKWNNFGGVQATGQYTEGPILVTALSRENYERISSLRIASKNPEDLAAYVVNELSIP